MRKLTVAQFISLDGVVETPEAWHFPYVSPEMFAAMGAHSGPADTMLLGRVTYDGFAKAFANAPDDAPGAALMNRPEKVVASNTLTDPAWRKTTVLAGDVVDGVTKLKDQPGGDILTTGSITLARTLLRAGLVDELALFIHPIVVGHGRRLFEDNGPTVELTLTSSSTFATGVTHQVYAVTSGRGVR
jgi:dihydrofolate reductase